MVCDFLLNGLDIKVNASEKNTNIEDSYRIKKSKDMKWVIEHIRLNAPSEYIVHTRTLKSQIREWRAHNLLYALNIQRLRTKSVDLDKEPKWKRFCYFILSCLYFHI